MPLDPNIILGGRGPQIQNPLDVAEKAMTMRKLAMQNQAMTRENEAAEAAASEQKTITDILKKNTSVGPNGQMSINSGTTLSELTGKVSPKAQMETQKWIQSQDLDTLKNQTEANYKLTWQITPENYRQIKEQGLKLGLPGWDRAPDEYIESTVKRMQLGTLSGKEQVARMQKERELNIASQALGIKQKDANTRDKLVALKQQGLKDQAKITKETLVPGLGNALNATDAKDLKTAKITKAKFDRQIDELIKLRQEKGVEYLDREAVARGKQLSKDLLLTYKNLAKLGVLSQADEAIVNAIIPPDPLAQDWAIGQDPVLSSLTKFKGDLDADYNTTLETRLTPESSAALKRNLPPQKDLAIELNEYPDDQIDKIFKELGGE